MELVRLFRDRELSKSAAHEELQPLIKKFGKPRIETATDEILVGRDGDGTTWFRLTDEVRRLAAPLLGAKPATNDEPGQGDAAIEPSPVTSSSAEVTVPTAPAHQEHSVSSSTSASVDQADTARSRQASERQIDRRHADATQINVLSDEVPVRLQFRGGQQHPARAAARIGNSSSSGQILICTFNGHASHHLADRFRRHELAGFPIRDASLEDIAQDVLASFLHCIHERSECVCNRIAASLPFFPCGMFLHRHEILCFHLGLVLLARDPKLDRQVAIKIMSPALASAVHKERFLREARSMAAIRNDFVIDIYQVDEERSVPFLVMPVLRGETLDSRCRRVGRLSLPEVLKIGKEIATGLAAAHSGERKLIHRDIKPANIWLEERTDRVKLLDFGLALEPGADLKLTNPGAVMGSAPYMSPEQASCAAEIDERTDLFSLGSVLYEMSTGRMAFKRDGLMNTLNAVVNERPLPPAQLVPNLSPEFSTLVMQLLDKTPASRPTSAAAVARELEELQRATQGHSPTRRDAKAILRVPVAKPSAGRPPRERRPVVAAVAAVLLSLSFLLAAIVISLDKVELEITTDDAFRVTLLEDNEVLLKDVEANSTLRLRPGQHDFEILLTDAAGKELGRFTTTDFKIVRGGKPVLEIRPRAAEAGIELPHGDRAAAEWVLASCRGARIRLSVDGQELAFESGAKLPATGDVWLLSVAWDGPHVPIAELPRPPIAALIGRLQGTRVTSLQLQSNQTNDTDLKRLAGLKHLGMLDLMRTPITDAGLAHLAGSTLWGLNLAGTDIGDEGLRHLSPLKELTEVELEGTKITDSGITVLEGFPRLTRIGLTDTRISAAGLARLVEKLPNITNLKINGTFIGDAAVEQLTQLKKLRKLDLRNTQFTPEGIQRIREALPKCEIES